jgi:serine palmitoyltransferase
LQSGNRIHWVSRDSALSFPAPRTRTHPRACAVKSTPAEKQQNNALVHYTISGYADGPAGLLVNIEGREKPCVTFVTQDFLGLGGEPVVRKAAADTLDKYTVGSCGPRGFYGTTLKHLELEDAIASFLGTPTSITYSDTTATIASAIPAFAKRGDVLLIDGGANFGIQMGASLSRSKIVYWNHNDLADLERRLEAVADSDGRKRDSSLEQRRFIVVEGLYANTGDLCPLREVQRLAGKYRWRIIVDDSLGFGVLGPTGRGICEHWGLDTLDVDVLVGSLGTALGSVGGFCVGSREVVDHQRLSGQGYCFSASAPPFLMATAAAALGELVARPSLLKTLKHTAVALQEVLKQAPAFHVVSQEESPVKHLLLVNGPLARARSSLGAMAGVGASAKMLSPTTQRIGTPDMRLADARVQEERVLDGVITAAAAAGVLLARTHALPSEAFPAAPSIKICVTTRHTAEHLKALLAALLLVSEKMDL